jgi:hypothetical protein
MPTNRRRRPPVYRAPLEASMKEHFMTGDFQQCVKAAHASGDRLVQLLFQWPTHAELWQMYADELIAEWVATYGAGVRPSGFWEHEAPSPRHWIVNGSAVPPDIPDSWQRAWRELFGVQLEDRTGRRCEWIESQPHYLRRFDLLIREEQAQLRPAAFRPERVADLLAADDDQDEDEREDEAEESVHSMWREEMAPRVRTGTKPSDEPADASQTDSGIEPRTDSAEGDPEKSTLPMGQTAGRARGRDR